MKKIICLSLVLFCVSTLNAPRANAQIPIWDLANWGTAKIIKAYEQTSELLKKVVLPLKRTISEVQEFFKENKENISTIVKNLALAKDIVELFPIVEQNFLSAHQFIRDSEHLSPKIKYYQPLGELWWRYRDAWDIFKATYDRNKAVMNDEQRINLFEELYRTMLQINTGFKTTHRQHLKIEIYLKKKKQEVATYKKFFSAFN